MIVAAWFVLESRAKALAAEQELQPVTVAKSKPLTAWILNVKAGLRRLEEAS
jgi:hypothetical protein